MSRADALRRADQLRGYLIDRGLPKVSIELVEGRGGSGWSDDHFVATLGHHIVSRRSQGLTPFLYLAKVGRPDVAGPLYNGYLGFDLVPRLICMGWANHSGQGGPYTVPAGVIPRNNGRPYLFGWGCEGGLDLDDWTPEMHVVMARCFAGTLDWLGRDETSHTEHKVWATPPGRKVDRLGYSEGTARRRIAEALEEPMPDDITAETVTAAEITETGDRPGLDAPFATTWPWARNRRIFSEHTKPDDVVSAEELSAFLHRYHHRVVLPEIADALAHVSRGGSDNVARNLARRAIAGVEAIGEAADDV